MLRPCLGTQLAEKLERARRHRLVIKQRQRTEFALELASQEHVGRGRQIVCEREILVDDLDAHGARIDRTVEMNRFAFEVDLSPVRREISGDDLHERRFPGAIVSH